MNGNLMLEAVDRFLFYQESPKKAAIFRIALGIVLLLTFLLLAGNLEEWFSSNGIFPASLIQGRSHPLSFSFFFLNDSPEVIYLSYSALLILTALFTLGLYPQLLAIPIFLLTVSFHNRNPELFHAGDMLLRFILLLNIFIDSGRALSPWRTPTPELVSRVPGWPFRVLQIQLCILYFFAACSKTASGMWMNGEHIFAMLNFPGRGYWDFIWLRNFPAFTSILTYSIPAIELSFPFLVWFKGLRPWVVFAAVLMHLGILMTINVIYFSEIMFVALISFLSFEETNSSDFPVEPRPMELCKGER